jgi:hypothetical protein
MLEYLAMTANSSLGISEQNPIVARPYAVGLFDVLGFKDKFEKLGLEQITARYAALIDIVMESDRHRAEIDRFFPDRKEGPYWCSEAKIVIDSRVYAVYASDTFLVWSNYTWSALHTEGEDELERLSQDPLHDWLFYPVPCDPFLDVCNELICRSLQVGLPLRGALAVGDGVFDKVRNIFLGQPIIDAHMLEVNQRFIGAGMCNSFTQQTIPLRYRLMFDKQLKSKLDKEDDGLILDWPRHWRNTRKFDVRPVIESMNTNGAFSDYYQNTLDSIELSEKHASDFELGDACPIRSNYEQFSYSRGGEIAAYARPVRRVSPEELEKMRPNTPDD